MGLRSFLCASRILFPLCGFLALTSIAIAQAPCATFPANFVPFSSVFYISAPDRVTGDRLLVGNVSTPGSNFLANYVIHSNLPLPAAVNREYCGLVTLTPRYSYVAYVPTQAEKEGDSSAFNGSFIDPFTNLPFPNNLESPSELLFTLAFRIAPVGATVPEPTLYTSCSAAKLK